MRYPKGWTDDDELDLKQWMEDNGLDYSKINEMNPVIDYRDLYLQQRKFGRIKNEFKPKKRKYDDVLDFIADSVRYDRKEKRLNLFKDGNVELNIRRGSPLGLFADYRF